MARQKQSTPLRREASSEYTSRATSVQGTPSKSTMAAADGETISVEVTEKTNGHATGKVEAARAAVTQQRQAGVTELAISVGGIYASFLTWALLQERLTTTTYGPESAPEQFKFPVFLNTIQSLFAAVMGFLYLQLSTPRGQRAPAVVPSRAFLLPLGIVAVTSSLASPFGYAALSHIDYITFILAKSCKLLPVMFLHITVFRRRYPLHKYLVVLAVTAGVAVFTLHASSGSGRGRKPRVGGVAGNSSWGLVLLAINLLLDGLTNSTQDYVFTSLRPYTGPQMMSANNMMSSAITVTYLALSPFLAQTPVGAYLGMDASMPGGEFAAAVAFMGRHPSVWADVLGFAACGAVGQVFIFYTLSAFSSLLLVTVTVTRKMLTMMLSVMWFGHRLSGMQWLGVGLVFGGVGAEAVMNRREKALKEAVAAEAKAKLGGEGSKKEL